MKKLRTILVTVAAIVLIVSICSSCKKPYVTGFITTDLRMDDPTPSPNASGTSFSYNTYATVVETMSDGSQGKSTPVKAPLKMEFNHFNEDIIVDGFNIGNATATITYKKVKDGGSGNGILIIDSAVVLKLQHSNFAKEISFSYQGADYKSDKASGSLKNHRFVEVKLGSYTLENMSPVTINGIVYERKLYKSTVTMKVGGTEYTANIQLTLLYNEDNPPEDKIVSTKMINSGMEVNVSTDRYVIYDTWMELEHTWETGKKTTETVWARNLTGGLEGDKYAEGQIVSSLNFGTPTVNTQNINGEPIMQSSEVVTAAKHNKRFDITFTNGMLMNVLYWDSNATYIGKAATLEFPVLSHQNLQHAPTAEFYAVGVIDGVLYDVYTASYVLKTKFGNVDPLMHQTTLEIYVAQ